MHDDDCIDLTHLPGGGMILKDDGAGGGEKGPSGEFKKLGRDEEDAMLNESLLEKRAREEAERGPLVGIREEEGFDEKKLKLTPMVMDCLDDEGRHIPDAEFDMTVRNYAKQRLVRRLSAAFRRQ